jgi:NAD(P)-dependent dehydrogenase (short-subunit alcohol dehydrogenase family)
LASSFDGKVALVTGAGSGIGRASALAFAREGACVVVVDKDDIKGEETVLLVEKDGGEAVFVHADVSIAADVEAMVGRALDCFGRIDCAHNNAGVVGHAAATHQCTEENWDRTVAINLKGVWLCMRHEIPQMLIQGGGAIVNTSSGAGLVGFPGLPAYVASKHGIVGLTRAAALEYAHAGIRVNAICPGTTLTPMLEGFMGGDPEMEAAMRAAQPIGRMASPDEIAEAAVWLCSDAASFVTGHPLVVDGGALAQ